MLCCLGFALSDSPVGLAAYILEKFSTWTDVKGRCVLPSFRSGACRAVRCIEHVCNGHIKEI